MTDPKSQNEEQRTLILTGASRGIGHATVKRFSSAGWRVITCSRHAFPENCPWAAGPEDHIQVDLSDPADTARATSEMKARLKDGMLHALVNNAAISPKGTDGKRLGVLETDMDIWRHVFEVNLFSTIWLAQGLKDALAKAHGAIVNVTSIAGSRVHPFAARPIPSRKRRWPRSPARWQRISGRSAYASTPSPRARSTPRSCRREPRNWWKGFPWDA